MRLAALLAAALLPSLAIAESPRDSDGDVISMIEPHVLWTHVDGGVVVYMFRDNSVPVAFTLDDLAGPTAVPEVTPLPTTVGTPRTVDAGGPALRVGATTYAVERSGSRVWVRDTATGRRIATERRVVAGAPGRRVNPNAFGLD